MLLSESKKKKKNVLTLLLKKKTVALYNTGALIYINSCLTNALIIMS